MPYLNPWPAGKDYALLLTHDVETAVGRDNIEELRAPERERGFRSSWNFVPERYDTPEKSMNLYRAVVERVAKRVQAYLNGGEPRQTIVVMVDDQGNVLVDNEPVARASVEDTDQLDEALSHIGTDPEVSVTTCKLIAKAGYRIGDRVVRAAQVLVVDPVE